MSPLDQDAALTHGASQNGVMAYADLPGAPSRTEVSYEPELEGSSYQTAPITALAIARWPWAVIGLVVGALLGFLSATGGGWQASSTLQINISSSSNADPTTLAASTGQSLQAMAGSDAVLGLALTALKSSHCPAASLTKDALASSVTASYTTNTTLVTITAKDADSGLCAGDKANAVANAVQTKLSTDADKAIATTTADIEKDITSQALPNAAAENQRVQALGSSAGTQQAAELANKTLVSVISASLALPAGPDRTVSALLGAAGGAFLGALAGIAAGAGRRKPHSPRELTSLAPDLTVRTTVQAGELAGRVLETGRRTVVVLALPDTKFAATQLGMAIAHHLRTHGATVALVDRASDYNQNVSAEDRLWALRRDVRRNVPANFSADMLVVVAGVDEEALSLIAGQTDLLVAVVAKQRHTILADIRRTVDAVRVAEPVVVLAR